MNETKKAATRMLSWPMDLQTLCVLSVGFLMAGCGDSGGSAPSASDSEARLAKIEKQYTLLQEDNLQLHREVATLYKQVEALAGRPSAAQRVAPQPLAMVPAAPPAGSAPDAVVPSAMPAAPHPADTRAVHERLNRERQRLYSMMRGLAQHPPERVAAMLNERKIRTENGQEWDAAKVTEARKTYGLDRLAVPAAQAPAAQAPAAAPEPAPAKAP